MLIAQAVYLPGRTSAGRADRQTGRVSRSVRADMSGSPFAMNSLVGCTRECSHRNCVHCFYALGFKFFSRMRRCAKVSITGGLTRQVAVLRRIIRIGTGTIPASDSHNIVNWPRLVTYSKPRSLLRLQFPRLCGEFTVPPSSSYKQRDLH
ncbi:hypothetical protein B0H12DRAFT_264036 [Mycena haematopus]|nr:hypothetical protein B0H12DRAFT_264036 [Mycena haematopus]